jgi:hypothetical protein
MLLYPLEFLFDDSQHLGGIFIGHDAETGCEWVTGLFGRLNGQLDMGVLLQTMQWSNRP